MSAASDDPRPARSREAKDDAKDARPASTLPPPTFRRSAPGPSTQKTPGTALDWLEQVRDRAERVRQLRESAELAARSALDACDRALESLHGWRTRLEARKAALQSERLPGSEAKDATTTDAGSDAASAQDASSTMSTSFEADAAPSVEAASPAAPSDAAGGAGMTTSFEDDRGSEAGPDTTGSDRRAHEG